jgi:hypothetical protein
MSGKYIRTIIPGKFIGDVIITSQAGKVKNTQWYAVQKTTVLVLESFLQH